MYLKTPAILCSAMATMYPGRISGAELLPDVHSNYLRKVVSEDSLSNVATASKQSEPSAQRFKRLYATWKKETWCLSSTQQKSLHPAYQAIIGMGMSAVPHITAELKKNPSHWFWALRSIFEPHDPARLAKSFDASVSAWLAFLEKNCRQHVG